MVVPGAKGPAANRMGAVPRNWVFLMSLNSVNTNASALLALQSLNAINAQLATVQNRISTGLKVASPKDDPATWAIAQNERSQVQSLDAVTSSLQRGQSIVDVAMTAGTSISDLLSQMKEKMVAATDTTLSADERSALNDDYVALRHQIDIVAGSADFNGVNLVSAGGNGQVKALANTQASGTIDVAHNDLSTTGSALAGVRVDLTGTISSSDLNALTAGMNNVTTAVSHFGTGSKMLDTHLTFIGKLQDTLNEAIGNLVDADIAKESAKLQSLKVQQQLAVLALGIANSQPSYLLQLFQH
jgi:flagellin